MSSEEPRLGKVVDIRRWREEKARQAKPGPVFEPAPEPRLRGLALTLGFSCFAFGVALVYLPFWVLLRGEVTRFSIGLLFGLVLPSGLGIALLGGDLLVRTALGRAGEGWYLRRIGRRRRPSPPEPGEDPPRFGSRRNKL